MYKWYLNYRKIGTGFNRHFIKDEMWITNRCENMLSFTLIRKMKIWATVILWYIWCIWHQEHITFYSPCCIQQSYFQWQPWAEALCDVKGTKCFKIDVDADSLSLMDFFFFFWFSVELLLEKKMAIHSSILAWKIPWTGEPNGLQSMGSQRIRHNWETNTQHTFLTTDLFCWITCLSVAMSFQLQKHRGTALGVKIKFI